MPENKHQRRDDQRPAVQLVWDDDQVAPIRTWRERIGAAVDFPLHAPTDVERAMEAEIAELRARPAAKEGFMQLEMNDDLRKILGRPNFTCIEIAGALRAGGVQIETRAEDEQAATILFLLNHYLRHGPEWMAKANEELQHLARAAGVGTEGSPQ